MSRELIEAIEASGFECKAGRLENLVQWQKLKEIIGLLSAQFDIEKSAKVLADKCKATTIGTMDSHEALENMRMECLAHLQAAVHVAQAGHMPMMNLVKILRRTIFVLIDKGTVAMHADDGRLMIANPNLPPCVLTPDFMMKEIPMITLPLHMQKVSGPNTEAVIKKVPENGDATISA